MRTLLIALSMVVCGATASAAQEVCTGLLSYTGRDISSEARENAIAASLFTQHCEGSSAKQGSATSVGLEAVVKAIPIKFNFGGSSSSEKLNNFCRVYDSRRSEFSTETIDTSIVVREALQAFNTCISLAGSGIYFNPKVGKTNLVIDVRRGSDDAYIRGLTYDATLLQCYLPPTPTQNGESQGAKLANKDSVLQLDGNFVPITCDRLPQNSATAGERVYPSAELTIGTSRGSLFLGVPADASLPLQFASDLSVRMAAIETASTALSKRSLRCDKSEAQTTGHYPSATAVIPAGSILTGGGCATSYYPESPDNAPTMHSRPSDDKLGWFCQAGDPPNIPLTSLRVTAYAVYCSLAN